MKSLTMENYRLFLAQNPQWWAVNLLEEDRKIIEEEARTKNQNCKAKGYVSKTSDTTDTWNIAGMAGEYAASLMLNLPWKGRVDIFKEADLGSFVEVKSCLSPFPHLWNLVVNDNQLKDEYLYLNTITALYPRWVFITGYAWGNKIRSQARTSKGSTGHGIRILSQEKLGKPVEVFDAIRQREGSNNA